MRVEMCLKYNVVHPELTANWRSLDSVSRLFFFVIPHNCATAQNVIFNGLLILMQYGSVG